MENGRNTYVHGTCIHICQPSTERVVALTCNLYCVFCSRNPRLRTENFGVQAEQVLIFWGIFSNNRLIRFLVGSYLQKLL